MMDRILTERKGNETRNPMLIMTILKSAVAIAARANAIHSQLSKRRTIE
jgi:hypothetical protein